VFIPLQTSISLSSCCGLFSSSSFSVLDVRIYTLKRKKKTKQNWNKVVAFFFFWENIKIKTAVTSAAAAGAGV
jgi:hypothetical protein